MTELLDVLLSEHRARDDELKFLKECQVRYFYLAVVSTAAIFSLSANPKGVTDIVPSSAPLLVVLPCWWIFFDKATTISRIVGYNRLLETMIIQETNKTEPRDYKYVGWETALFYFRQKEAEIKKKLLANRVGSLQTLFNLAKLLSIAHSHKYWMMNYFTFCGITVATLLLSFNRLPQGDYGLLHAMLIAAAVASLFVFGMTLIQVYRLVFSWDMYNTNADTWLAIDELKFKHPQ